MSNDLINGLFELIGGILCWLNVWRLWRDRCVMGVSKGVTAFFTAWGFWNLWYYPALGQPLSFIGACFLTAANLAWVLLAWRIAAQYRKLILITKSQFLHLPVWIDHYRKNNREPAQPPGQ